MSRTRFYVLAFVAVALLGATHSAYAKTTSYTSNTLPVFWDDGTPDQATNNLELRSISYTVMYGATITNTDTGGSIVDGSSVPTGTHIRLSFTNHATSDLSWFATGGETDSPNGYWGPGTPPSMTCNAADFLSSGNGFSIYIPFYVTPPTETITPGSNLTCSAAVTDASGNTYQDCTITSAGTVAPSFSTAVTQGRFYHRYLKNGSCRVHAADPQTDTPMRPEPCGILSAPACNPAWTTNGQGVNVPVQTINFSFTATQAAAPPSSPIINPGAATTCAPTNMTVQATDPNNDQIKYGLDWNNDGVVDEWVPPSGFVNSGTSQAASHTWSTAGTYTFKALAQDSTGASSGWATYTLTVTSCVVAPTAVLTAAPTTIPTGSSSTLTWSTSNSPTSCSIDHGIGAVAVGGGSRVVNPAVTTTYTITCSNSAGSGTDTATVTVTNLPIVTLSASPASVNYGSPSTLTWTAQNAASCSIDNGVGTVSAAGGSTSVTPLSDTNYTLTCTNANGSGTDTASVTVVPPPLSCSVSPSSAAVGASVTWTATLNGASGRTPYSYAWTLTGGTPPSATNSSNATTDAQAVTYASAGTYGASLSVTDNKGRSQGSVTCSGDVNGPGTVTVATPQPDLTTANVTFNPPTVTVGTPTTLSALVSNSTTATGKAFTDLFEIDNDATHTLFNQIYAKVPYSSVALGAGGSNTATGVYTFPTSGTWYIRACADTDSSNNGVVTESNDNNNCSPNVGSDWQTVVVSPPSGNNVSCVPSPFQANAGDTVTWTPTTNLSGAITYTWTDANGLPLSPTTGAQYQNKYSSGQAGNSYSVSVQASNGTLTANASCSPVTINGTANTCNEGVTDSISVDKTRINSGSSVLLSWSATGVSPSGTTCSITGTDASGSTIFSQSSAVSSAQCNVVAGSSNQATVSNITSQSTFTINCQGTTNKVIVNVIPNYSEF